MAPLHLCIIWSGNPAPARKANPEKCLCLLSELQGVSLAKTSRQRKQVQSHAMNSSTPHVFNTPATSNTRHRPNLIEYDGARDDPVKMSAVRDRKKRG